MEVLLRPKGEIGIMVEAEVISPDIFAGRTKEEIEGLVVWQGPTNHPLSEFFEVALSGDGPAEETAILIDGDVPRVKRIGHAMNAGRIEIRGSVGMHVGSEMSGGSILVKGNAGSWAGMEMKGGLLQIEGDAGDHVGSAYRGSWRGMSGGSILIEGDARSQLGGGLSGGEIVVGGDVENFCGIRQAGGLILAHGTAVRGVGALMNGGTIAVCGGIKQFPPGFVDAGQEEDPKLGENQLVGIFNKLLGDYAIAQNPKGVLYVSGDGVA